jgi:hypothetical protein
MVARGPISQLDARGQPFGGFWLSFFVTVRKRSQGT